jgi:raffinose/stachyose/melibiose transport system substrate-binding protein
MQPPKNRDELEAVAEELQGQDITPFAAGIGDDPAAIEWFPTVFWNHYSGPDALYQALTGEIPFSDPVFVDAMELFNNYVQKGWFGGSQQKFFSNSFDALHADLGDGKAAMNIEGSWFLSDIRDFFKDSGDAWDWAPLPPLRSGVPPVLYELGLRSTLSVNRRAGDTDGSAAFIDYLTADKKRAAAWMAAVPSAFNAPLPFTTSDFPASMDPRVARQLADLSEATGKGNFGYTAWTFWPSKSDVYIQEESQKVLTGDITAAEFCKGLNEQFTEERKDGAVPKIIKPGAPSGAGYGQTRSLGRSKAAEAPDCVALHDPARVHKPARHPGTFCSHRLLLVHRMVGDRARRVRGSAELQGSSRG